MSAHQDTHALCADRCWTLWTRGCSSWWHSWWAALQGRQQCGLQQPSAQGNHAVAFGSHKKSACSFTCSCGRTCICNRCSIPLTTAAINCVQQQLLAAASCSLQQRSAGALPATSPRMQACCHIRVMLPSAPMQEHHCAACCVLLPGMLACRACGGCCRRQQLLWLRSCRTCCYV